MRTTMRSWRRVAAPLLVAGLVLTACGGGDDGEAAADPPADADDDAADTQDPAATDDGDDGDGDAPEGDDETGDGQARFVQELADRLPPEIAEAGRMTWVNENNPPGRIPQDGGGFDGFEADFAEAVSTMLGIEIDMVDAGGLPDILLALESERYDFFIGPLKSTAERQESFDFIVWMVTEASFIHPSDLDPQPQTVEDLCGLTVSIVGAGVLNDFTHSISDDCTAAGNEPIEVLEFADRDGGILAVSSGRADAHGTTALTALYFQSQEPDGYEILSHPIGAEPDPLGSITSASRPELGEFMLEVFEELQAQGVYDRIVEDWNLGAAALDEFRVNYAYD